MKCENCGSVIAPNDKFCNGCGACVLNNNVQTPVSQPNINENQGTQYNQETANTNLNQNTNNIENNMASQIPSNNSKNNKTGMIISFVIMLILVGIAAGFGGYYLSQSSNSEKEESNKENNTNNGVSQLSTSTEVYFSNSLFSVPKTVSYEIKNNQLLLYDNNWYAAIQEVSYPYQTMSVMKEQYTDVLTAQGIDVLSYEEKTVGTNNYIIYNVESDNFSMLMAFREGTTYSSLLIGMSATSGGKADISLLEDFDKKITIETNTGYRNSNDESIDLSLYNSVVKIIEK